MLGLRCLLEKYAHIYYSIYTFKHYSKLTSLYLLLFLWTFFHIRTYRLFHGILCIASSFSLYYAVAGRILKTAAKIHMCPLSILYRSGIIPIPQVWVGRTWEYDRTVTSQIRSCYKAKEMAQPSLWVHSHSWHYVSLCESQMEFLLLALKK